MSPILSPKLFIHKRTPLEHNTSTRNIWGIYLLLKYKTKTPVTQVISILSSLLLHTQLITENDSFSINMSKRVSPVTFPWPFYQYFSINIDIKYFILGYAGRMSLPQGFKRPLPRKTPPVASRWSPKICKAVFICYCVLWMCFLVTSVVNLCLSWCYFRLLIQVDLRHQKKERE